MKVAAQGAYSSLLPSDSDSETILAGKIVTFNNMQWYLIEDNSTSENEGTVTLLSKDSIESSNFNYNNSENRNIYKNSLVKEYLDGLTGEEGIFYGVANVIEDTDLTDVDVSNAKLYILSSDEAELIPKKVRKTITKIDGYYVYQWWLRTPEGEREVFSVDDNSNIRAGLFWYNCGIRPALKLDLRGVSYNSETKTFETPKIDVTEVTLDRSSAVISMNGALTLNATVKPVYATSGTVTWASSNEAVATVSDEGVVTAVAEGAATITVTAGNGTVETEDDKTATCTVTVCPPHVHTIGKGESTQTISFEPWIESDFLPDVSGNFFLTEDVELSGHWNVPKGTTNLCLNGHRITCAGTDYVIQVFGSTLSIFDETENKSTFNLHGGSVNGNNA